MAVAIVIGMAALIAMPVVVAVAKHCYSRQGLKPWREMKLFSNA
jgi:hypothetical protein